MGPKNSDPQNQTQPKCGRAKIAKTVVKSLLNSSDSVRESHAPQADIKIETDNLMPNLIGAAT